MPNVSSELTKVYRKALGKNGGQSFCRKGDKYSYCEPKLYIWGLKVD